MSTTESISLRITRVIQAPRQKVFDAWVNPELRKQWWCAAEGMYCDMADIDAQRGGRYRINMKSQTPEGEKEYICVGEFLEYEEPSKLVFTWSWEDYDQCEPGTAAIDTVVTVELKEVDQGTELTLTHEKFANEHMRDEHSKGWAGCLESLARVFAG